MYALPDNVQKNSVGRNWEQKVRPMEAQVLFVRCHQAIKNRIQAQVEKLNKPYVREWMDLAGSTSISAYSTYGPIGAKRKESDNPNRITSKKGLKYGRIPDTRIPILYQVGIALEVSHIKQGGQENEKRPGQTCVDRSPQVESIDRKWKEKR
jgi:hypothetical protein